MPGNKDHRVNENLLSLFLYSIPILFFFFFFMASLPPEFFVFCSPCRQPPVNQPASQQQDPEHLVNINGILNILLGYMYIGVHRSLVGWQIASQLPQVAKSLDYFYYGTRLLGGRVLNMKNCCFSCKDTKYPIMTTKFIKTNFSYRDFVFN